MTKLCINSCYKEINSINLSEETQYVPFRYSLVNQVEEDIFEVLHPPVQCRDFLSDAIYCSHTDSDIYIYGFQWNDKFPKIENLNLLLVPYDGRGIESVTKYVDNLNWLFSQINVDGWEPWKIKIVDTPLEVTASIEEETGYEINTGILLSLDFNYTEYYHLFSLTTWLIRIAWYRTNHVSIDTLLKSSLLRSNDAAIAKELISTFGNSPIHFLLTHKHNIFIPKDLYRKLDGPYQIHDEFGFITLCELIDGISTTKQCNEELDVDAYIQTAYNAYTVLNNYGVKKKGAA